MLMHQQQLNVFVEISSSTVTDPRMCKGAPSTPTSRTETGLILGAGHGLMQSHTALDTSDTAARVYQE